MMTTTVQQTALRQQAGPGGSHIPIQFDEHGFILHPLQWTEELAEILAKQDGIAPLGEDHWRVIRFVRDRFLGKGAIPPVRSICRNNAVSKEQLKTLFGSCHEVWRISGLPDPGAEARSYMR